MERRGPMAAHTAFDIITQEIREVMKELDDSFIVEDEELKSIRRPGKKKVVIVKEIMGQGAMHDNFILPVEPCGILGARANVDLGNLPVCMSPLEVLDGCIHALTCILEGKLPDGVGAGGTDHQLSLSQQFGGGADAGQHVVVRPLHPPSLPAQQLDEAGSGGVHHHPLNGTARRQQIGRAHV